MRKRSRNYHTTVNDTNTAKRTGIFSLLRPSFRYIRVEGTEEETYGCKKVSLIMIETDPLEILSLYQYDATKHSSVLSFQSAQTTERLLDKLELSPEDEEVLGAVLKDEISQKEVVSQKGVMENRREGESQKESEEKDRNDLLVCLPASGFPSLKNTCFTPREILRVSLIGSLGEGLCTVGEQHFQSKPRCSYFVEEIDFEDGIDDGDKTSSRTLGKKSPFHENAVEENIKTDICRAFNVYGTSVEGSSTLRRNTDNKTDKGRIDTVKPITKSPSSDNGSLVECGQNFMFKCEEGDDSMYESSVGRNNSSVTTNVSSRDSAIGDSIVILNTTTIEKTDDSDKNLEIPTKNTQMKSKAEKNSFHLKNLFGSRKNLRRKDHAYSREGNIDTTTETSNANGSATLTKSPGSSNAFMFSTKSAVPLEYI